MKRLFDILTILESKSRKKGELTIWLTIKNIKVEWSPLNCKP